MNILFNIPKHKNCVNCGECCGVVPATMQEVFEIKKFLKENPKIRGLVRKRNPGTFVCSFTCPFRNETEKTCDVYEVRPMVCRLYGVASGEHMKCLHGNTHEIDGLKFLQDHNPKTDQILNLIKW